jgi:hypothetical protein
LNHRELTGARDQSDTTRANGRLGSASPPPSEAGFKAELISECTRAGQAAAWPGVRVGVPHNVHPGEVRVLPLGQLPEERAEEHKQQLLRTGIPL